MVRQWRWWLGWVLVMMMLGASPVGAQGDRRLNPHDAEYYAVFCQSDTIDVYVADGSLVLQMPIAYVLGLDETGGTLSLENGMMVRRDAAVITLSGSNGSYAPSPGSKQFSLNTCLDRNDHVPEPVFFDATPESTASASDEAIFDCTHTVQPGDTAWGIVLAYNTTLPELARYNRLDDTYMIAIGQELILPGCAGVAAGVTVQADAASQTDPFRALLAAPDNTLPGSQSAATIHTVQLGEMLAHIAAQYGVTVEAILAANTIDDADMIWEGQVLVIPAR